MAKIDKISGSKVRIEIEVTSDQFEHGLDHAFNHVKEEVEVKLVGNVDAVCQMTGCWMDVEIADCETVHVTFKDDKFLMPNDASGKKAIIEGVATFEEIPVDMLKHLAQDEGKTQEEIDAINEPAMEYTFVATGVILEEITY